MENKEAQIEIRIRDHVDHSHEKLHKQLSGQLDGMETRLREYIASVNERTEEAQKKADKAYNLAIWLAGGSTAIGFMLGLFVKVPGIAG
jgi:ElaB/YqjD/DUF883 family membrane-anchored ribosome-binding protein